MTTGAERKLLSEFRDSKSLRCMDGAHERAPEEKSVMWCVMLDELCKIMPANMIGLQLPSAYLWREWENAGYPTDGDARDMARAALALWMLRSII